MGTAIKHLVSDRLRLRSHWYEYEYESRVRVSVYGSYKLHPYEWAFMDTCTRTTQRVSTVYRQSPVKSDRENALRKSNNIPL